MINAYFFFELCWPVISFIKASSEPKWGRDQKQLSWKRNKNNDARSPHFRVNIKVKKLIEKLLYIEGYVRVCVIYKQSKVPPVYVITIQLQSNIPCWQIASTRNLVQSILLLCSSRMLIFYEWRKWRVFWYCISIHELVGLLIRTISEKKRPADITPFSRWSATLWPWTHFKVANCCL